MAVAVSPALPSMFHSSQIQAAKCFLSPSTIFPSASKYLKPADFAADQYRVCPLSSEELSEECFQKHPLPFAGAVALEWQNGSRLEIQGRFLSTGTVPAGSTWARQPMPYSNSHTPPQFEPPCDEKPDAWKTETGVCSGRYLTNVSIVDWLTVPKTTPSGDYVLQLRYDCEVGCPATAYY